MHPYDKGKKIAMHLLGRFPRSHVVVACVDHHNLRTVFQNKPIKKVGRVANLRSPEAAVDCCQLGKILGQSPAPNARTANKQDRFMRWRIGAILRLELCNVFFPWFRMTGWLLGNGWPEGKK